jgi:Ca2+-binding EF-hand superfamily protein
MEEHTTQFFNTLSLNSNGKVKVKDIIKACVDYAETLIVINPSIPTVPNWINQLQMENGLISNSEVSKEKFLELNDSFSELNSSESRFSEIDEDNDGIITFEQLLEAYRLPPHRIPQTSSGAMFLEMLKEKENLTDETEISLEEFLSFENKYPIMHSWPPV